MAREIDWHSWDALCEIAAEYRTVIEETGKYGIDGAKHKARAEGIVLLEVYQIMHLTQVFGREEFEAHPNFCFSMWVRLSKIEKKSERDFYLHMVAEENWSVWELDRTIQDVRHVKRLLKLMKRFAAKQVPPPTNPEQP